jgi:hypothetical protein
MRPISSAGAPAPFIVLALSLFTSALAGDPETLPAREALEPEAAAPSAATSQTHLNLIDQRLALSLAVDAHAQIEMAEFALKTIATDELRRFMTERLEAQRAFAAELDALTGGRAKAGILRAKRDIEDDKTATGAKSFKVMSLANATALLARIRLEILQEYAELQRGDLSARNSGEFDRSFLRADILNQMQMLATLKVFEAQASRDFAQVIHRAWTTTKDHLDRARQVLERFDATPLASSTAAQPKVVETASQP